MGEKDKPEKVDKLDTRADIDEASEGIRDDAGVSKANTEESPAKPKKTKDTKKGSKQIGEWKTATITLAVILVLVLVVQILSGGTKQQLKNDLNTARSEKSSLEYQIQERDQTIKDLQEQLEGVGDWGGDGNAIRAPHMGFGREQDKNDLIEAWSNTDFATRTDGMAEELDFNRVPILSSPVSPYQTVTLPLYYSPGTPYAAWASFWRKSPDDKWQFIDRWSTHAGGPVCSTYNTPELRNAFAGQACARDGGGWTVVEPNS